MRAPTAVAVVAFLAGIPAAISGVSAQSTVRAVALAGDPAPGGGSFEHFGVESLPIVAPANTKGQVAFFATMLRSTASEAFFLASQGREVRVMAEGDPVPGGGVFSGFGRHPIPALNERGDVAFAAAVVGGRTVEGIFLPDGPAIPMVTGAGSETPIGGIFVKFSERVTQNDAGAVAFTAVLKSAEAEQGIFVVDDARLRKVTALGETAPGGGTFAHFSLWPALAADGSVAFAAAVDGSAVQVALFVASARGTARVVALGDVLGPNRRLASFGLYPVVALSPAGGLTFATTPGAAVGIEGLFFVAPPPR